MEASTPRSCRRVAKGRPSSPPTRIAPAGGRCPRGSRSAGRATGGPSATSSTGGALQPARPLRLGRRARPAGRGVRRLPSSRAPPRLEDAAAVREDEADVVGYLRSARPTFLARIDPPAESLPRRLTACAPSGTGRMPCYGGFGGFWTNLRAAAGSGGRRSGNGPVNGEVARPAGLRSSPRWRRLPSTNASSRRPRASQLPDLGGEPLEPRIFTSVYHDTPGRSLASPA